MSPHGRHDRRASRIADNGFTLLEVMVSVALIGGVFAMLLSLQTQSIDTFRRVREQGVAVMLAQDRLERLRIEAAGYDPVDEINPVAKERYPDYEVSTEEMEVSEEEIPLTFIYPAGWSITKWKVTVKWGGGDGRDPKEYALVRYIALRENRAYRPVQ